MEEEDDNQEENHGETKVSSLRNIIDLRSIHSCPHHIDPTLGCHYVEKCDHRIEYIIEIRILIDPFAAIIQALKPCLNVLIYVLSELLSNISG